MSSFFAYICTRSTAEPFVPSRSPNVEVLARDVSDAFTALQGGYLRVGQISLYPVQRAVPNHLLCDGREVSKASFAELYAYVGDSGGAAVNPYNFKLPNYLSAFTPAGTADPETTNAGTVSTPVPGTPPPTYYPGQSDSPWGDVDSGGKAHPTSSASDTTLAGFNSATLAPVSNDLEVVVGSAGNVQVAANGSIFPGTTPPNGTYPSFFAWQWWDGGAWVQLGAEEVSAPPAELVLGVEQEGSFAISRLKTGLVPTSTAKFRLMARNDTGTRVMTLNGEASAVS